jgi:HPt (histidine-containing phosphotransfer) domain-containing protein
LASPIRSDKTPSGPLPALTPDQIAWSQLAHPKGPPSATPKTNETAGQTPVVPAHASAQSSATPAAPLANGTLSSGQSSLRSELPQSLINTGEFPVLKVKGKDESFDQPGPSRKEQDGALESASLKKRGKDDTIDLPAVKLDETAELPVFTEELVRMHNSNPEQQKKASWMQAVDLPKLNAAYQGADLRVVCRVYFQTAERVLKEATEAIIQRDARMLRARAHELKSSSESFSATEMTQLSRELVNVADKSNWTEGKILVEALRLALDNVKNFNFHSNE